MKELQVLERIGNTPSKLAKEALLREHDTPTLRKILLYAFSPFLTFRVKQIDIPEVFNSVQPNVSEELFLLLDLLASHTVGSNEAKAMIKRLLAKCTENNSKWICKIICKDLKIGMSESTANKVFPGLVPEFKVQLALAMVDHSKGADHWDEVVYPCGGTEKIDGMLIIAICNGETVNFFSRTGLEYTTLDHLIPQILKLGNKEKFVLVGESVGVKFCPACEVAQKNKDAGKPWNFAQGLSMTKTAPGKYSKEDMNDCLGYLVWDVLDYDYFVSQGSVGKCLPKKYRRTSLCGLFERLEKPLRSISLLPSRIINDKVEAMEFFKEVLARDGEGIVLDNLEKPYEFKRSPALFKVKGYYSADLRVIDCTEGSKGSKNEGSLGSITVSDGEITGKLMGGWDVEEGLTMWFKFKRGEFVNSIVELAYMDVTADKSLRHAVFVRERDDKTEISWG